VTLSVVGVVAMVAAPSARAATAGTLDASDADLARAKQLHKEAARHFDLGEFQPAMDDFRESYRLTGDPVFLFNIAQCYRKLGNAQDALTFYQTYLRREPNAANRDEVERRIKELGKQEPAAAKLIPSPTPPVGPAAEPAAAPSPAPPPAIADGARALPSPLPVAAPPAEAPATLPPGTALATQTAAPESEAGGSHFYGRWWFWTAAGAVIAGGVVAGVLLTRDGGTTPFCGTCNDTAGIPTK
jgi:tetratricopeptide (TPR) repeat protein